MKICLKWLVLFCCALMLCSCNASSPDTLGTDTQQESAQGSTDVLDNATQQKIKQDYAQIRPHSDGPIPADDVTINRYLGTYQDGAIALLISARESYTQLIVEEDIAGIHFTFPNSQPIYIYSDSQFFTLKEAFESNIISKSDVEKIYDAFVTKEH